MRVHTIGKIFLGAIGILLVLLFVTIVAQPGSRNPHGSLDMDCLSCHQPTTWKDLKDPLDFAHEDTGFPLVGGHETADCMSCHSSLRFSEIGVNCADCHTDIHLGQFGIDCQSCHSPENWENRQEDLVLHMERGFPLTGVHAVVDCQSCHINEQRNEFSGTPVECSGCHLQEFNETLNPDHRRAQFELDCIVCHSPLPVSWQNANYQHPPGFEIRGAHLSLECNSCHAETFAGIPQQCVDCHLEEYELTFNPSHSVLGFPKDCMVCHNETQWEDAVFDHLAASGFELRGAHATTQCITCHTNNQYAGLPRDCYSCHQADYAATLDPNHQANNFPTDCMSCHSETTWSPADFDHNLTDFPLTGAHIPLDCLSCHGDGYANTPVDCYSCHQQDYISVDDPDHVANNFSQDCLQCHTTNDWENTTFDHGNTQFPLTGAHVPLECLACHESGYSNIPFDCYSCHQQDYISVDDPDHVANNFSQDCLQCHTTNDWENTTFDHGNTQFPLTGAHVPLECLACHESGYSNIPFDCYSCHQQDFISVDDPDHVANNFSQDCLQCHTTNDWENTTFDHGNTQFPLTGAHVPLECLACHESGYSNIPFDCYSCHQQDYISVDDPDHVANNFSQDCLQCHTTNDWENTTFDHGNTQFPLTGAHVPLECLACHESGYSNIPFDCYSCHQQDYISVDDPDHVANNFSQDCLQCHTTNDWENTTFDHGNTQFPLTGAHVPLECLACHESGYSNIPFDCYSCHQQDYISVDDPNHVANNFSQDCLQCHTTNDWENTTFDHGNTQFPLTGAHVPLECLACHESGYSNIPFDCYSCHQQDFISVDDPDHVANNFSQDCLQCHTTNDWENTTFDHGNTQFPLTGAHINLDCLQCHSNGYTGTPANCFSCHQSDYNGANNPNHAAAGFPTDCESCHNTSNWDQANFNHAESFPIYSGEHQGEWDACADCHINNVFPNFECIFCHEHNQPDMDDKHDNENGYVYQSQACYDCHPNGQSRIMLDRIRR